ncbi:MAG: ribosome silencing factor [Paludibacteraceae bacterium]|nr:ribosome silencing factor [Paludibacteraceae bacterium]
MDVSNKKLISCIVEGMQELKAKSIKIVDMSSLEAPCQFFVICEGTSNTHVTSIGIGVKNWVRNQLRLKVLSAEGYENAEWVVLDYGQVLVHVFRHETREFYDIEHLWADAEITDITDID